MTRLWLTGEAIEMSIAGNAFPARFMWRDQTYTVAEIVKRWRVDSGWWERRQCREYVKLITTGGQLVIVYQDVLTQTWWLQRLYD